MSVQAEACTAQQAACTAAELRKQEARVYASEQERKERRRHLCGARKTLHYDYGIPKRRLELAAEVTHTIKGKRGSRRGLATPDRDERAYEFRVDGLLFRVTEAYRMEADALGYRYVKRNGEYVYDYIVRVYLPVLRGSWLDRPWLKRHKNEWFRLPSHNGQAALGRLLLARGPCF